MHVRPLVAMLAIGVARGHVVSRGLSRLINSSRALVLMASAVVMVRLSSSICVVSLLSTQVICLVGHRGLSGMQVLLVPSIVSRVISKSVECRTVMLICILGLIFSLTNPRVR